jgi:hypothetical protein
MTGQESGLRTAVLSRAILTLSLKTLKYARMLLIATTC